jgi:two-component system NarL family sensor kinase
MAVLRPSFLLPSAVQQDFWQQYKWTIILSIALLTIESLLIAALLREWRRKNTLAHPPSERELVQLTGRLFDIQDQERRRIARELHDGTAQNLFAISVNLQRLYQLSSGNEEIQRLIAECQSLDEQSLKEIRTLSYLLHPPLLDQAGLVSALQWYVEGFTKRSGIFVEVFSEPIGRLQSETEMALFRIVQEALSNVHRHSASEKASIRLTRINGEVVLQIKDQGKGLALADCSPDTNGAGSLGVGIPGMKQRLRQLGGTLEITSNHTGTTVSAVVPIAREVNHGTNTAG